MFAGIVLIAAFVFCCFPSDSVLASEKPPFTDYCQRLEQEVQGRKHGFLAGGGFKHGRYIAQKAGTPLCKLHVTMLNKMGIETKSFAQSTGELTW